MKESLKQQGFTLIEVIVALLVFSLLMSSLWEFFSNTYSTYVSFNHQVNLDDEARRVCSFIREEIRSADEVTIVLDGVAADEIYQPDAGAAIDEKTGNLKMIKLNTIGGGTKKPRHFVELTQNGSDKAGNPMYKFEYKASGTPSLISDKIKNIKVMRQKDSSIVEFTCSVGEANHSETVEAAFSESLEYKGAYTP